MADDVSAALQSVGAAPLPTPFGLKVPGFSNDPNFQAGVKRLGELGGERQQVQQQYDKDAGAVQQKLGAEQAAGAAIPQPKMENVSEEFKHMGMRGDDLKDVMQTMFAFAAIGGAMTRTPMTAALNAFSGAMKGLVEGDKINFQQEKNTFDRHMKTAIAKNAQAREEYKAAFDKHRGNMQDLMNEWQIIAKRHGDSVSAINMERQDIQGMLRQIESMGKMDMQMKKTDAMIQQGWARIEDSHKRTEAAEKARGWTTFQKPDGTVVRINTITGERGEVEGTAGLHKPIAKGGATGAMTSIQATMYEDVATGFFRLDKLKEMAAQTGELPGGSPFLQAQMHADGLVSVMRNYAVNKTLPENLLQSDALLLGVAFDVASARSGGRGQLSDAKIREVTRQMPLQSDPPDTRALKYELLNNQLTTANHTLPGQYQYDPATKGPRGEQKPEAAPGAGPYPDAEKEARYQKWKAEHAGTGQ